MEKSYNFDLSLFLAEEEGGVYNYRDLDRDVILLKFGDCYIKQIEPDYPNMVCTQLSFSGEDLSLKEKGLYLKHGGISIGVWETYNEYGKVTHTEDMDQQFPVSWQDVEQILKDNKISLVTAHIITRYVDQKTNKPIWSIGIKINEKTGLRYNIDAQTGDIISKRTEDLRIAP